jgi:FkbM family methyltransferase
MKARGVPGTGIIRRIARLAVPLPSVDGPVLIRTSMGYSMLVDPLADPTLERPLFEFGTYEPGTLRVLGSLLRSGDTCIDVGANIGLMTLVASHRVGNEGLVVAVEPVPRNYEVLIYNISLNRRRNVRTYNLALGAGSGSGTMLERPDVGWVGASLVRTAASTIAHQVRLEALDSLIAEKQLGGVSVVKIDVEGWELEVLKGATGLLSSRDAPAVIIEYSTLNPIHDGQPQDIFDFMRSVNEYEIFKLQRGKWTTSRLVKVDRREQLPRHDNLFCILFGIVNACRTDSSHEDLNTA